jgi:hypothetical protein
MNLRSVETPPENPQEFHQKCLAEGYDGYGLVIEREPHTNAKDLFSVQVKHLKIPLEVIAFAQKVTVTDTKEGTAVILKNSSDKI